MKTEHKRRIDDSWNFKEKSMKELTHGFHSYPAMLMPYIVRRLLETYALNRDIVMLDPYIGSGTTAVEAKRFKIKNFYGTDLNPLAVFISNAKIQNYNYKELLEMEKHLTRYIQNYDENYIDINKHNFKIRDYWFKEKNVKQLIYIKSFIDDIENETTRMFYLLIFSQVVRKVSMTRNGEFKLYRIDKTKIEGFLPNVFEEFSKEFNTVLKMFDEDFIKTKVDYNIKLMNANDLYKEEHLKEKVDLIITSPPYGDSHTTVSYGQYSRLSNEWLGFDDSKSVDKNLMGGRKNVDGNHRFNIKELDDAIDQIRKYDETQKNKRHLDVISFYIDYINSIKSVSKTVKEEGIVIYVVGNRRVRNYELPTDIVTYKAFEQEGFAHIETIVRQIQNKRMPFKGSPSNRVGGQIKTMTEEYIVIMKKNKKSV